MPVPHQTRTYAVMQVSKSTYDEIHAKLVEAGYEQALYKTHGGDIVLDMHGIALSTKDGDELED